MVPPNWTKIAVAPRRIRLQKVQLSSSSSEDPEVDGTDAVIEKDRCNRIKQRSRKKADQNFSTRLGLLWWRRGGASARQVLRFCRLCWQLPLPRGEFIIFQEVQVCTEEDVWCGGDEVLFRLDVKQYAFLGYCLSYLRKDINSILNCTAYFIWYEFCNFVDHLTIIQNKCPKTATLVRREFAITVHALDTRSILLNVTSINLSRSHDIHGNDTELLDYIV